MKKIRLLSLLIVVALFVHGTAFATPFLFDFEDAPFMGIAGDIEAYMEGVYGSDVTVIGGRVANWSPGPHGPLGPGPLGPDNYIQAGPEYCPSSWFSFSFNEVPITSVSFDWGTKLEVEIPIPMIVYSFGVSADDVGIFSREIGLGSSSGGSDIIFFDIPVTTLKFTVLRPDVFELEVDNLMVTPVPEPSTITFVLAGMLALARRQRRRTQVH